MLCNEKPTKILHIDAGAYMFSVANGRLRVEALGLQPPSNIEWRKCGTGDPLYGVFTNTVPFIGPNIIRNGRSMASRASAVWKSGVGRVV